MRFSQGYRRVSLCTDSKRLTDCFANDRWRRNCQSAHSQEEMYEREGEKEREGDREIERER